MAKTLLHLAHRFPYPPDKGDRIRTYHTLRHLARDARVYLACLADEPPAPGAVEALEGLCARVAVVPLGGAGRWARALGAVLCGRSITEGAFRSRALAAIVRQWAGEVGFDACLASASSMVSYLRLPELTEVPAVVDLMDVDSQKWFDYAAASRAPRRWLYSLEGRRLRKLERGLPSWTRGVVLTTPAEVAIYEGYAGDGAARAVTNGVDLEYFAPAPPSPERTCAFVGALDYRPNVDGLVWFCEEVWGRLVRQWPDARLFIVGRRPTDAVRRLSAWPGVEVIGTVPDVRPWLARASVAVVPLRIARGVQNKVLEAMAMARPVVASPLCLQGMDAAPGTHLLTATTPDEWVDAVGGLFSAPERRGALGEAGRAFVEENHCWERCLEPLREMLFGTSPSRDREGAGLLM